MKMSIILPENLLSRIIKRKEEISSRRTEYQIKRKELIARCNHAVNLLNKIAEIPLIREYIKQIGPINLVNMTTESADFYVVLISGGVCKYKPYLEGSVHPSAYARLDINEWNDSSLESLAQLDTEEKVIQRLEEVFRC